MKFFIAFAAVLLLAGCASPTLKMTDQEIVALNDSQLCAYQNGYGPDVRRDSEIARRRLICDPYERRCLGEGNQPGTPQMEYCVHLLRENQRLRDQTYDRDIYFMHHSPRHGGGVYLH